MSCATCGKGSLVVTKDHQCGDCYLMMSWAESLDKGVPMTKVQFWNNLDGNPEGIYKEIERRATRLYLRRYVQCESLTKVRQQPGSITDHADGFLYKNLRGGMEWKVPDKASMTPIGHQAKLEKIKRAIGLSWEGRETEPQRLSSDSLQSDLLDKYNSDRWVMYQDNTHFKSLQEIEADIAIQRDMCIGLGLLGCVPEQKELKWVEDYFAKMVIFKIGKRWLAMTPKPEKGYTETDKAPEVPAAKRLKTSEDNRVSTDNTSAKLQGSLTLGS